MDLIERAAALILKSREDFILDASCDKTQEILLDQRLYIVSEEQFDAFEKAFTQSLSENKGLQNLMSGKYSF